MDVFNKFFKGLSRNESGITFQYLNKYTLLDAGLISQKEDKALFSNESKLLSVKDIDFYYDAHSKLMPGDIILKINGVRANNPFEVDKLFDESKTEKQSIAFIRNGKVMNRMIETKKALDEITRKIVLWEDGTFQNTNIHTRRYYSIREEGVLLSKCGNAGPWFLVGGHSQVVPNGKAALITHIDGKRVRSLCDLHKVIEQSTRSSFMVHYFDYIYMAPMQMQICEVRSREVLRMSLSDSESEVPLIKIMKCS